MLVRSEYTDEIDASNGDADNFVSLVLNDTSTQLGHLWRAIIPGWVW